MNVNTASYFSKQKNNIVQARLAAGKFAAYSAVDLFAAGATKSYDFSEIKATNRDGVSVGQIINTGLAPIEIKFNLKIKDTVTSPGIELKVNEAFDIGQFNGRVYDMEIENISATDSTMIEILGV